MKLFTSAKDSTFPVRYATWQFLEQTHVRSITMQLVRHSVTNPEPRADLLHNTRAPTTYGYSNAVHLN